MQATDPELARIYRGEAPVKYQDKSFIDGTRKMGTKEIALGYRQSRMGQAGECFAMLGGTLGAGVDTVDIGHLLPTGERVLRITQSDADWLNERLQRPAQEGEPPQEQN